MKNAPDPSKNCMGNKKMPYASRISASNRSNIKIQMNKCIGFWTSKCTKPAQGQKNSKFWTSKCTKPAQGQKKSFELQSAPNLHRDKKNKKNKNFRGIVAPSQVDCEVFILSLCRFGALWSSKLWFFLSLCRFGALWSSKLVFFCPCAGFVHFTA